MRQQQQKAGSYLYDALNAAANGYTVLPADARTGEPLVAMADASSDPETIRGWWDKYPAAAPASTPPKPKKITATPFVWRDPKDIPQREFLYGTHLIRKYGSAKFAAGGIGKSILVLTEAIALATYRALLGISPAKRCRVWYWNGEDPKEETERRIAAICLHYKIAKADLEGWLFIDSGREQEIIIAQQHPKIGAMIAVPVVEAVTDTMLDNEIDVMIIDPFVSSHRIIENDNPAMDLVAKKWTAIADATKSAIELIHHTKKTGGAEATVEDGRGAVALLAAVRSAQVLNKMTADEAAKAGLESPRGYLKVENGKANLAPPAEGKDWYRIISVALGNGEGGLLQSGDNVGVIENWTWPDYLADVTGGDFDKAAQAIRAGKWRQDAQSKDWVGYPIAKALEIDLDSKAGKSKTKALLRAWLEKNALYVVDGYDQKSNLRKFVEVRDE